MNASAHNGTFFLPLVRFGLSLVVSCCARHAASNRAAYCCFAWELIVWEHFFDFCIHISTCSLFLSLLTSLLTLLTTSQVAHDQRIVPVDCCVCCIVFYWLFGAVAAVFTMVKVWSYFCCCSSHPLSGLTAKFFWVLKRLSNFRQFWHFLAILLLPRFNPHSPTPSVVRLQIQTAYYCATTVVLSGKSTKRNPFRSPAVGTCGIH